MTYPIDHKIVAIEAANLFGFKSSTFYSYQRYHKNFPRAAYLTGGRQHYYDVISLAQWFSRFTERRPYIDVDTAARYPIAREVLAVFEATKPNALDRKLVELQSVGENSAASLVTTPATWSKPE